MIKPSWNDIKEVPNIKNVIQKLKHPGQFNNFLIVNNIILINHQPDLTLEFIESPILLLIYSNGLILDVNIILKAIIDNNIIIVSMLKNS